MNNEITAGNLIGKIITNPGKLEINGKLFYQAENLINDALKKINSITANQTYYFNFLKTEYFPYYLNINELFNCLEYKADNIKNFIEIMENIKARLMREHRNFGMDYYQEAANKYDSTQLLTDEQKQYDEFAENRYNKYLYLHLDEMYKQGTLPSELYAEYIRLSLFFSTELLFTENLSNHEINKVLKNINYNQSISSVIMTLNNIERFKNTIEGSFEYKGVIYNFKYGKCDSVTIDGTTYVVDNFIYPKIPVEKRYIFSEENIKNGRYGGDQSDFANNYEYFLNDPQMNTLIEKFYPNATTEEKHALFNRMTNTGCGYIAFTNEIFRQYEGKENEFSETFGYPMYYVDATGKINYNTEYLAAELFLQTHADQHTISELTNDWHEHSEGKVVDGALQKNELKIETGTNPSKAKKMEEYLESEYGLNLDVEYIEVDPPNTLEKEIITLLSSNENLNITIGCGNSDLYNMDGSLKQQGVGGHAMTVTGLTEKNEIIVSSWGEQYIIDTSNVEFARLTVFKN